MSKKREQQPDSEPVVQTRYASGESVSEAVIRALAAAKGIEPTELGLLYESIDPEALDALFGDPIIGDSSPNVVEFVTSGYRVTVSGDGLITIMEDTDDR